MSFPELRDLLRRQINRFGTRPVPFEGGLLDDQPGTAGLIIAQVDQHRELVARTLELREIAHSRLHRDDPERPVRRIDDGHAERHREFVFRLAPEHGAAVWSGDHRGHRVTWTQLAPLSVEILAVTEITSDEGLGLGTEGSHLAVAVENKPVGSRRAGAELVFQWAS